jgi:A/G-specific adenine glycosylase
MVGSGGTENNRAMTPEPERLRRTLLDWYDRNHRDLPWRAPPGTIADPYRVWLSEIMLQQTMVATVVPYFRTFVSRWPTVRDLAAADLDDVLHAWQGLGYYARARNLHACARIVAGDMEGRFPDDEKALRALPGIGAYTAAAIAAIAFGREAVPVDGNVLRVAARLFAVAEPLPGAAGHLGKRVRPFAAAERAGDFAQAFMELGATVCTPSKPSCGACPWADACAANATGRPEDYPPKAPGKAKPVRHGVVFHGRRGDGAVLLRRRPEVGLLGGMMEFPTSEWRAEPWAMAEALRSAPLPGPWAPVDGMVRHTFTHFRLELMVMAARLDGTPDVAGIWCPVDALADYALPTLMKKVARLVENQSS